MSKLGGEDPFLVIYSLDYHLLSLSTFKKMICCVNLDKGNYLLFLLF